MMYKLMLMLGLLSGVGFAACTGPYCYDDTGAEITATVSIPSLKAGLLSLTTTQMATNTPDYAGELAYCNTGCTQAAGWSQICYSTGTGVGAWVYISSKTLSCDQ